MIRNLTPHLIRLAPSPDPETWMEIPSSGRALLETTPGKPRTVEGCPVPVMGAPTYGEISGLPETCDEGDLLIVAFPVAARVPVEIAKLAGHRGHLQTLLAERFLAELVFSVEAIKAREDLAQIEVRLTVLRCVVQLGTGPEDDPIRWTETDRILGRCVQADIGQPRAVTRLVSP